MKLTARDISAFLAKPDKVHAVLIYGPDRGLIRQRQDQIIAKLLKDPQDPFNRIDISPELLHDDPARLADELASMSLLGGMRVIVVRDVPEKLGDTIAEALEHADGQNYLIITADELSPRSSLRKVFESKTTLAALACYKEEGQELGQTIEKTLIAQGYRIDRDAVAYLMRHLATDRQVVVSELEKLALYQGEDKHITLETAQAVIGSSDEHTLDHISQAVGNGQIDTLVRILDRLFLEGMAEVAVLRSVHRHFTRLQEIHTIMAEGKSADAAVKSLRPPVFFKEQPVLKRQAERWRPALVTKALHLLMQAERDVKLGGELSAEICTHSLMRLAAAVR